MCTELSDAEDFSEINKDNGRELIGAINRRYSIPPNTLDQFDRTERAIALAAAKVLPEIAIVNPSNTASRSSGNTFHTRT